MVSFTRVISLCFATQTWRRRLRRYRQRYSLSDKYLFIFHASREINYKLLRTPNVPPVNVSRVSRIPEYPGPPPATPPPSPPAWNTPSRTSIENVFRYAHHSSRVLSTCRCSHDHDVFTFLVICFFFDRHLINRRFT